ncbi:MAG: right-handed parallel beta-helix repeat-containing protein [Calditrichia bacterium]
MKICAQLLTILLFLSMQLSAADYYVDDVSSNGNGSQSSPFNDFDDAMSAAQPGDVIYVMPGTYDLSGEIASVRDGSANQRITIKAFDANNRPLIERTGRVMEIDHRYITIDGLRINGKFGDSDVVRMRDADYAIIRNTEIFNGTKDGIDMHKSDNVLIEDCEIHHMLGGTISNQVDAHGIVATGEKNLTIRGCDIYYVSGDCFQTDPNRGYPLWDNVLVENSKLWTGPLPGDAAGWDQGEIPGENGIDTKINPDSVSFGYRPKIVIRNVVSYGFEEGYINNRSAMNIKENIDCTLENVVVFNNEIGYRLRGPGSRGGAQVLMINCVGFNNDKTFRLEDGIENLKIYNSTFNNNGGDYIQNAGGGPDEGSLDVRNNLFVSEKPSIADDGTNLVANSSYFIDMANHDYHLSQTSPAIDAGDDISMVTIDFDGNPRFAGSYDAGADEFDSTTGISSPGQEIAGFELMPNFPNPFNPETTIPFRLDESSNIQLSVFNIVGQKVTTLVEGTVAAGSYEIKWNGLDDLGNRVGTGVYIYRLQYGNTSQTLKMHLIQ